MPRNGSGTYSIPNSFSAGATIASSQVNANFTDVGAEITGSLPVNGEKGMSGQLKAASGTVLLPGLAFSSDTDCGFYRIGADNVGLALNGAKVVDFATTGAAVTGTLSATGALSKSGTAVECFAGSAATKWTFYMDSAPTGWTIVTASMNDRALRVVSGSGAGGGTGGATGGATAFTSVMASRTILQANLPNVTLSHSLTTDAAIISLNSNASGSSGASKVVSGNAAALNVAGTISLGGSGTAMDFAVTYASVIICSKD